MSKIISTLKSVYPNIIEEVEIQYDGYMLYLMPGWFNYHDDMHIIQEATVKDVLITFHNYLEPCNCFTCRDLSLLIKEKSNETRI